MARKKQEIALQSEINNQEEWDEFLKKEGLLVVDVYQDWCGPCKAVTNFFRRIKNEIGDDYLIFAVAKVDTIDSLEKYRNKCEPCFLIYGGRSLVGVIRGANPPVLESTIKLKLEEEHKVMKGEMERKETKDPGLADVEFDEKIQDTEKDVEEIEREITLALIKPDAVRMGKVDEIITKLEECGIEILAQQDRNLTVDEAKEFYHHMADSEFFEELIKFIISGPSKILVLAKGDGGIIQEFRDLIGPKTLDEAKEKAPTSIRAVYGTNTIENAIHGADNYEAAQRELAFFFPDFVAPKISRKKHEEYNVQRTLALIRPAAFTAFKETILEKISNAGFKIAMQNEVKFNREDAALFYNIHKDKPFFEELITEMSKGTLLALALEKKNAVQGWRGLLGPKDVEKAKEVDPNSFRAQFSMEDIKINLLHGSDSEETAAQELKYFFPIEQTIAAIKPDGFENEEEIINKILDTKFQIVKSKKITMDKDFAEQFYSDQKDQDYFNDLITHMQSGPTLFMILSREDAIRGWRSLIGPKDPKIADETYPDSIRAIYGRDIKKNAVYGSDNRMEVQRVMNFIFGHLEFNEDGTILEKYMNESDEMDSKEELLVLESISGEDHTTKESISEEQRLFNSSERIIMEPEVSDQTEIQENKIEINEEVEQKEFHEEEIKVSEETVEHSEKNISINDEEAGENVEHSEKIISINEGETEENVISQTITLDEEKQHVKTEDHSEIIQETNLNESYQETVVENEITIVEDQSIVTYEENTVSEEVVVSHEETNQTESLERSLIENETSGNEITIVESQEVLENDEETILVEDTSKGEEVSKENVDKTDITENVEESSKSEEINVSEIQSVEIIEQNETGNSIEGTSNIEETNKGEVLVEVKVKTMESVIETNNIEDSNEKESHVDDVTDNLGTDTENKDKTEVENPELSDIKESSDVE